MAMKSLAIAATLLFLGAPAWPNTDKPLAIVGATVIDGEGGSPLRDAVMVIEGQRIVSLGPRATTQVPRHARIIDARRKFVTPGLIDVNVHVTGLGFMEELFPLLLYGETDPISKYGYALEAAQMALKFGVTTLRDTYGPLPPLLELRDRIARGEVVGPRLQVAGDILGWGGSNHDPLGRGALPMDRTLTPIQEHWNDYFRAYAPVGIELTTMYPQEARKALDAYLDKGPDFIKIGVTSHSYSPPINITFSPRVLRALVDEAHQRGIKVDVHSSLAEGHLLAAEAGVDVITHAEGGAQELSDEIVGVLREKKVICAIFGGMVAGPVADYLEARQKSGSKPDPFAVQTAAAIWPLRNMTPRLPMSSDALRRSRLGGAEGWDMELRRRNAHKLIEGGCIIAVGTDAAPMPWPELKGPAPIYLPDPGIGTIIAIEALVRLGMTAGDAIVAATKHGAMATGKLDQFGTLAVGKLADLLILRADPLADIANLRQLETVIKEGRVIDPAQLPTNPRYYRRK